MNVCLINPASPWLTNQKAFPPLGMLYLASAARDQGFGVKAVDLGAFPGTQIPEADVYGISSTTPQYPESVKLKKKIRKKYPSSKIVIGGAHPTYSMNGSKEGFDEVIKGYGEDSLISILGGEVNVNGSINDISPPARDLLDINEYQYKIGRDNRLATTIITSRGCPHRCGFCAKSDRNVRFHSAEYVCKEIESIVDQYGFRNFLFIDDCFSLNHKRLKVICKKVKGLGIKFRCYVRADTPKEILDLLKDSGCLEVGMGIESGSQEILDIVDKKTTVGQNTEVVRYCNEIGMVTNVFLMIGLPGETKETARKTVEWARKAQPSKFGYNIFMPYPGCLIHDENSRYPVTFYKVPDSEAFTKSSPERIKSYVSTPGLSRKEITDLFHENFDELTKITKWNPALATFGG